MNKVFSHSYSDLTINTQLRELVIGVITHPIRVHMYLEMYSALAMVAGRISSTCWRAHSWSCELIHYFRGSYISWSSLLLSNENTLFLVNKVFSHSYFVISSPILSYENWSSVWFLHPISEDYRSPSPFSTCPGGVTAVLLADGARRNFSCVGN